MGQEWNRYRAGNCWVTACYLSPDDDPVTVETVGAGVQIVGAGNVLIQHPKPDVYDVLPVATFESLGFEYVPTNLDETNDIEIDPARVNDIVDDSEVRDDE